MDHEELIKENMELRSKLIEYEVKEKMHQSDMRFSFKYAIEAYFKEKAAEYPLEVMLGYHKGRLFLAGHWLGYSFREMEAALESAEYHAAKKKRTAHDGDPDVGS